MTAITPEDLRKERENLEAQRLNAIAIANQAAGAVALVDALLARLDEPMAASATLEDIKSMTGADSVEIVPVEAG